MVINFLELAYLMILCTYLGRQIPGVSGAISHTGNARYVYFSSRPRSEMEAKPRKGYRISACRASS